MKWETLSRIHATEVPESDQHQRRLRGAIEAGFIDQTTLNHLERYGFRINTTRFIPGQTLKAISSGDLSQCVGIIPNRNLRVDLRERKSLVSWQLQLARIEKAIKNGLWSGRLTPGQIQRRMAEASILREKILKHRA